MPIASKDILEIVRNLIRQHGGKAAIHSGMEADAAMSLGYTEAAYQWQRVTACIEDMLASPTRQIQ